MSILHYMIEFSDAGLEGTGSLIQSFRVAARAAKHLQDHCNFLIQLLDDRTILRQ